MEDCNERERERVGGLSGRGEGERATDARQGELDNEEEESK
jgi:hypothetical protein